MTTGFVYDRQDEMLAWAETRILGWRPRADAVAIGREVDGRLVGVTVFDTFSPTTCFFHLAAGERRWLTKEFIIVALSYPFLQCGYPRLSAMISENNRLSLRLARIGGWVEEGRMRKGGIEGEDIVLFGMLREEAVRYLPMLAWPS